MMNRVEREMRRREQARIASLNRVRGTLAKTALDVAMTVVVILLWVGVFLWAAAAQSEQQAWAASGSWEPLGSYTITYYCPCRRCSDGWGHQTASGTTAVEGVTVAVDPRVIPYGTHLMIDGHEYIAQDCGGGVRGKWIDIFMESHEECLRNGMKKLDVYIRR